MNKTDKPCIMINVMHIYNHTNQISHLWYSTASDKLQGQHSPGQNDSYIHNSVKATEIWPYPSNFNRNTALPMVPAMNLIKYGTVTKKRKLEPMTNNMNYDIWQPDSNTVLPALHAGQATTEHLTLHIVPSAVSAGTAKSMLCGINTTWQTQHFPYKPLMMETVSKRIVKSIMTKLIAQ
jgi:hypothetical protein